MSVPRSTPELSEASSGSIEQSVDSDEHSTDSEPAEDEFCRCRPFIFRNSSHGRDLSDFFTKGDVLKVKSPRAQSTGRNLMLRDWIDHHDFHVEDMYVHQAMKCVDWKEVLPHERLLAYEHAKRRATTALKEHIELQQLAQKSERKRKVTLASFSRYKIEHEDEDSSDDEDRYPVGIFDFDSLPGIEEPDLADHPQLPKSIVALAMAYREIWSENNILAQEVAEWKLFLSWLYKPYSATAPIDPFVRARQLRSLFGEPWLKEAACYIQEALEDGIAEYTELQKKNDPSFEFGPLEESFGTPPKGWPDICAMSTQDIEELTLFEPVFKMHTVEQLYEVGNADDDMASPSDDEDAEPTPAEAFRPGLAFRANSLNQLESMLKEAKQQVQKSVRSQKETGSLSDIVQMTREMTLD